jgi:hypothetical protein
MRRTCNPGAPSTSVRVKSTGGPRPVGSGLNTADDVVDQGEDGVGSRSKRRCAITAHRHSGVGADAAGHRLSRGAVTAVVRVECGAGVRVSGEHGASKVGGSPRRADSRCHFRGAATTTIVISRQVVGGHVAGRNRGIRRPPNGVVLTLLPPIAGMVRQPRRGYLCTLVLQRTTQTLWGVKSRGISN